MSRIRMPSLAAFAPHVWSPQQEDVFDWFERGSGNLVVRARAGTGKTSVVIEGINRAPEKKILLAAFNKAIANELESRVTNRCAEVKTLHALGLRAITRAVGRLPVDITSRGQLLANYGMQEAAKVIWPESTTSNAALGVYSAKRAVQDLHTKIREILGADFSLVQETALEQIFDLMERFDLIVDEKATCPWTTADIALAAYHAVVLATIEYPTIDFADMIYLPLVNHWTAPTYDLIVIDEAQDMSKSQLLLAQASLKKGGRIAVVGDDMQAIYGFRGADSDSLDRLRRELNAEELGLTTTYRCPSLVVTEANHFVKDFSAAPEAPKGKVTRLDENFVRAVAPGDFILARTNAALVSAHRECLKAGKPARIKGGGTAKLLLMALDKFKADTVVDLLAEMKEHFGREEAKLQKLPLEKRAVKLAKLQETRDLLNTFAETCFHNDDFATVENLRKWIRDAFSDNCENIVVCSTVHKAKGLEARNVFILCDSFKRPPEGEEKNIRYVAVTRAKQHLVYCGLVETFYKGVPRKVAVHDLLDFNDLDN